MWHGSTLEFLHTIVSEKEDGGIVQGGMSLEFKCGSEGGITWSPRTWALHDVSGNAEEFIQVELRCSDSENLVEVKNIVVLQRDVLCSEVLISNSKSSSLQLMGPFTSHIPVSTPDATYAVGLEGLRLLQQATINIRLSIIPPEIPKSKRQGVLSSWGSGDQDNAAESKGGIHETEEEMEGEEKDN